MFEMYKNSGTYSGLSHQFMSIWPCHNIYFSKSMVKKYQIYEKNKSARIYFDDETGRAAIELVNGDKDPKQLFRIQSNGKSAGCFLIAKSFIHHHRIRHDKKLRYDFVYDRETGFFIFEPEIEEKILNV